METAEKLVALKKCPMFASADDDALQRLAESATGEHFDANQQVFAEGEVSSRVYVVAWGALHVRRGETERLVSFAESGALFGEYAMFVKGVRMARVIAAETSVLLSFGSALKDAWKPS